MPAIRDLLARRSDLSTFVVHLTRTTDRSARSNLESILQDMRIRAKSPFGPACVGLKSALLDDCLDCQHTVCFTETPLEHLHLFLEPITDLKRSCVFEPYGIAFTKRLARETGLNPVWYTDITAGARHDWLMKPVNQLIDEAIQDVQSRRKRGELTAHFKDYPIAKLAPFVEQMGSGSGYRKEFWWEREWRHRGDYLLPPRFIIIAPQDEHDDIAKVAEGKWLAPVLIDARWGLEDIIGHLAGFSPIQIEPF